MNQYNLWWPSLLLCYCFCGLTFSASHSAEVPPIEKIVTSKGVVYVSAYRVQPSAFDATGKINGISIHSWNLQQLRETRSEQLAHTAELSPHWGVAYGHCWVTSGLKHLTQQSSHPMLFSFSFMELDQKTGLPGRDEKLSCVDDEVQPLADPANIGLYQSKFPVRLHYDYLPTSENALQLFVLTNVRGRIERLPPKPGESRHSVVHITEEECKTPKWSLTVFTNTAGSGKDDKWEWGEWKQVETIVPKFQDEFQVVARADIFYFLTKSGKVYQSKKPDKGKVRTMEELWTDKEQPVVTFVQDADNERTYVFTKNKKKDEKDVYFELSDKPKPVAYNLADAKPPKEVKEPLKNALPYVQILIADGKIKVPKTKE